MKDGKGPLLARIVIVQASPLRTIFMGVQSVATLLVHDTLYSKLCYTSFYLYILAILRQTSHSPGVHQTLSSYEIRLP